MDIALKNFVQRFLEVRGLRLDVARMETLRGDGSNRLFWRIPCVESNERFIVLSNPPTDPFARKENLAYVQIGNHLKWKGLPVPQIYEFNPDKGWVIMEDLGRTRLQDAVAAGQDPIPIYRRVVALLLQMQLKGAEGFETGWCCQTGYYDRSVMRSYESSYFRDTFLGLYLGLKKDWQELDAAFEHIADRASRSQNSFFLFRDFQSRNILVDNDRIGFVDWQGGRLGPLGYDLASLLIDPYTALSPETQDSIFRVYLDLLRKHDPALADDLVRDYPYLALQRNLQILGAFANLTKVHSKGYFEAYILGAMHTLIERLHRMGDSELSPLKDLMVSLPGKNFDSTSHHVQDKIINYAPDDNQGGPNRKKIMSQKKLFEPGTFVSTFTGQVGIVLSQQGLEKARKTYPEGKRPGHYFAPGCCQNPDYVLQVPVLFEDRAFDIMRGMNIRKGANVSEEKRLLLKTLADPLE